MINFPVAESAAATSISKRLGGIAAALDSGQNIAAAQESLAELRSTLSLSSGLETRSAKTGGVKYRATYMLNAVMLADNLRMIHAQDTDLLETVVKQWLH